MKDFTTYALIGDPVGHSLSPAVFNTFFQHYGMNASFIALRLKKGEIGKLFNEYADALALGGFTITMPHKEDVIPFLDVMSDSAKKCRAVNVVSFLGGKRSGFTTDGLGAVRAFEASGKKAANQNVVILGVGGASKSVAHAFREEGAKVAILSRSAEKAKAAAEAIGGLICGDSNNLKDYMEDCTLFINGSPLGMEGSFDFDDFSFLDRMPANATVFDAVYNPIQTALLQKARARTLHTVGGLSMLMEQMCVQFELLTGILPDGGVMEKARGKVEKNLAAQTK